MSYGSEKSFNGKSQKHTNPKRHKMMVKIAAIILILAAIAWTVLYTDMIGSSTGAVPVDPKAETAAPGSTAAP